MLSREADGEGRVADGTRFEDRSTEQSSDSWRIPKQMCVSNEPNVINVYAMNGATAVNRNDPDTHPLPGPPISAPVALPPSLVIAAGWAWRLLVLAGAVVALGMVLDRMYLITIPVFLPCCWLRSSIRS